MCWPPSAFSGKVNSAFCIFGILSTELVHFRLNTDVRLYRLLCETLMKKEHRGKPLSNVDLAVGDLFRSDFEASGIHLDEEKVITRIIFDQ